MLANLVLATRTAAEIPDFDAAAEWAAAGMPEYEEGGLDGTSAGNYKLVVNFTSVADRNDFVDKLGVRQMLQTAGDRISWSLRWPPEGPRKTDWASIKYVSEPEYTV